MRDPEDARTSELDLPPRRGELIGYARVSTHDQDMGLQFDALRAAGCGRIFDDVASGARAARPGLQDAMDYLRAGDTLVVWKIDRLGRSLAHLVHTVETLKDRGVAFLSLNDPGMNTEQPGGRFMFNLFALLADFERELIRERTRAGLDAARVRGARLGRRPSVTPSKLGKARQFLKAGLSVREAAAAAGVSKSALYAALRIEAQEVQPAAPASRRTRK